MANILHTNVINGENRLPDIHMLHKKWRKGEHRSATMLNCPMTYTRSPLPSAVYRLRNIAFNTVAKGVWGASELRCISSSPPTDATTADDETDDKQQIQHGHFATLGIQPSFTINQDDLKSMYKTLMGKLHPDRRIGTESEAEMQALHDSASAVTRAFEELSKPHLRAMHLLDISGVPINENDRLV